MKDFLFSLNVAMPMFIVMFVGYILMKKGLITEDFKNRANTLVFYVALPAKLFTDIVSGDIREIMDIRFVVFSIITTIIAFLVAWLLAELLIKDKTQIGAFVHGAYRGNFVYIGIVLVQNIMGKEVIACAPLIIAFVLPFYNILAVIILTIKDGKSGKIAIGPILVSIIKNPMIIAIFIAVPFSLLQVKLPFVINKPLDYLGVLSTPLALLIIGSNIHFKSIQKQIKPVMLACFYKLVVQPLVFVPLAMLMNFSVEQVLVIYVLFGVPSAINVYIMTKKMGGDEDLAANIVVMSIICSLFTLTIGVYIFKAIGFI